MAGGGEICGLPAASLWLLLLVGQNTCKTLVMRAAVAEKPQFLYSAAVLATEGLKAMLSIGWVMTSGGSVHSISYFLRTEWRLFLRVMVPAGIYNCQQMLEFVALSRLEAPVFSIIVQTKLLTTALFSVVILRKRLKRLQVVALVLLMVGVILAQMKDGKSTSLLAAAGDSAGAAMGITATLGIATLSGFAAVYTEMVLKRGKMVAHQKEAQDMLAYLQIHMALASLLMIGIFAVFSDMPQIVEYGLWHGFDLAAIMSVVSSALGGLIVAAVLKYADSVLKGYATAASVILTGWLSVVFFGTTLDLHFVLAMVTVICSIFLYSDKGVAPVVVPPVPPGGSSPVPSPRRGELRAAPDVRPAP